MKLNYFPPQVCLEQELPALAFLQAASATINDYEEINDEWN